MGYENDVLVLFKILNSPLVITTISYVKFQKIDGGNETSVGIPYGSGSVMYHTLDWDVFSTDCHQRSLLQPPCQCVILDQFV